MEEIDRNKNIERVKLYIDSSFNKYIEQKDFNNNDYEELCDFASHLLKDLQSEI